MLLTRFCRRFRTLPSTTLGDKSWSAISRASTTMQLRNGTAAGRSSRWSTPSFTRARARHAKARTAAPTTAKFHRAFPSKPLLQRPVPQASPTAQQLLRRRRRRPGGRHVADVQADQPIHRHKDEPPQAAAGRARHGDARAAARTQARRQGAGRAGTATTCTLPTAPAARASPATATTGGAAEGSRPSHFHISYQSQLYSNH